MVRAIVLRRANGAASSGYFQANGASSRGTGLIPVDLATPRRTGLLPGERGDFQWIWLREEERRGGEREDPNPNDEEGGVSRGQAPFTPHRRQRGDARREGGIIEGAMTDQPRQN